jgi:hypothetical protein
MDHLAQPEVIESHVEEPSVATRARMMLGTSPGILHRHDPASLPLDAVTYMLRADEARRELDADGVFLALNDRHDVESGKTDAKAIYQRTARLREFVQRLTGLKFVTNSDFNPEALERTYKQQDLQFFSGAKSPTYWQRQTVVVLHSLGVPDGKPVGAPLYKFGSIDDRDEKGNPLGGEVQFDGYLPANLVQPVYAPPAYTVKGVKAVPYLMDFDGKQERIAVPFRHNQIDRELAKLDTGVSRITYDTWMATAQVLLNEEPPAAVNNPSIVELPLRPERRELVTDAASLDLLRAKLRASLATFCS